MAPNPNPSRPQGALGSILVALLAIGMLSHGVAQVTHAPTPITTHVGSTGSPAGAEAESPLHLAETAAMTGLHVRDSDPRDHHGAESILCGLLLLLGAILLRRPPKAVYECLRSAGSRMRRGRAPPTPRRTTVPVQRFTVARC